MKTISRYIMTLALLITAVGGAWAAITTEDIGKVICTDGSLYATKILAQNDGKTAAAMIGYVDTENNKALAIALTDGPNNMNWTQASEYCTGLNTSLPVANGTWVLPTEEQWNSVLTLEEVVPGYEAYKSESLNTKLNAAKGNALDNESAPYWSATESSGSNYAKCLAFNYGMASVGTMNKTVADGSMTRAFLEIELSGIEVTTNAEEGETTFTEAWFQMPAYDATAEYELVRDMSIQMTAQVGDGTQEQPRYRVKKDGNNKFIPADMEMAAVPALFTVNDAIEQKALTQTQDYIVQIYAIDAEGQPTGEAMTLATFTFEPGIYAVKAVAAQGSDYDGETALSNTFKLFQGYEVQVAAKEFITYYKDEPLYADTETSADAELYTITSVSADQATLSAAIQTAPSLTPLLIFNNSDQAKTFLLIPANEEPNLALTVAPEFQGTLTGTTIAASTDAQTNYALNGTAFVFVKNAIEVGANKAWLSILTGAQSAPVLTIVFEGDVTGIDEMVNGKSVNGQWYDLNGRKLQNKPTKKGIYILNGKKVVVR